MPINYIPNSLLTEKRTACFYFKAPYKASKHNFNAFIHFKPAAHSSSLSKKRFSHLAASTALVIPLLNYFILIKLLQNAKMKNNVSPKLSEDSSVASISFHSSPPPPVKTVPLSRAARMAAAIENRQRLFEQETLDQINPKTDGLRNNPISIKELKILESSVTEEFFRLFPNETSIPGLGDLRKKKACVKELKPLNDDFEYIKSLILNAPGHTPESRFIYAKPNLAALYEFLDQKFPALNGEFYVAANYKNDMQNTIDKIPYVNIIKNLFLYNTTEFLIEINKYHFILLDPIPGERAALQINCRTIHNPDLNCRQNLPE